MAKSAPRPPFDHAKHRKRFVRVTSHPDFSAAQAWTPRWSALDVVGGPLSLLSFGLVATIAGYLDGQSYGNVRWLVPVSVGMFVAGACWMVSAVIYLQEPIQRVVAVVLDDREKATQPFVRRVETSHRVTLGFASGDRQVLSTSATISAEIDRGDIGVAYRKGRRLLGFRRFDV